MSPIQRNIVQYRDMRMGNGLQWNCPVQVKLFEPSKVIKTYTKIKY
jgi:hypothetical protein